MTSPLKNEWDWKTTFLSLLGGYIFRGELLNFQGVYLFVFDVDYGLIY